MIVELKEVKIEFCELCGRRFRLCDLSVASRTVRGEVLRVCEDCETGDFFKDV